MGGLKFFTGKKKKQEYGSWYQDNYRFAIAQRNLLFLLFLISLGGVIAALFVILFLNKMKTLEPFVIEIEEKTGIVTVVDQSTVKNFSANESVNNYFILKYLRLWEIFDNNNYKYNYYTQLRLFSSPAVFNQFLSYIRLSNPDSPINLYANNPIISGDIKVRSIQYIETNLVQIRFNIQIKTKRAERYENNTEKSYIASIRFAYNDLQINESERYINPLGFQVISYKKTEEFL